MATPTEFTYPYNPNGVLEECKIISEPHTITPSSGRNYNWFVPFAGPFFGFSVVLKHVASGKTLQRGVDYNLGLEYHVFNTQVTLRPVYGAIILIDTALTGQFTIDYMTIGGQYAINQNKALELVANAQLDPRSTYWENVTDIPSQFPVTSHLHNVVDITGMAEVVEAINTLAAALTSGGGKWFQSLNEHLLDWNDPHHVLEMITGGGGEAIPKATQQQAIAGTDNTAYMTPLRVAQQIAAGVALTISNHINATGNVHGLTAADINLGNVVNLPFGTSVDVDGNTNQNYYASLAIAKYIAQQVVTAAITTSVTNNFASQQEAEAGTNTTKFMSSLRVAQQIAAGVGKALQEHEDSTGNVHNLTADDINLGNVVNLPFGTSSDVDGNTNQTYYASLAIAKYIAQHVVDAALQTLLTNNFASQEEAEAGTDTTKFMSSLRVAQQIAAGVGRDLQEHEESTGNVHDLKASDINLGNVPNYRASTTTDIDGNVNLDSTLVTPAIAAYIAQKLVNEAVGGDFITDAEAQTLIDNAFNDFSRYPATSSIEDILTNPKANKLVTGQGVASAISGYGMATLLGVCTTTAERTKYLAQTSHTDPMVDLVSDEVWVFDDETVTWVLDTATAASQVLEGRTYYNTLFGFGYKATQNGVVTKITSMYPGTTVSSAAPPTDTSGYTDGHVWYQI